MVSGIIVAAGKGKRMKAGINKVFLNIGKLTVLEHTVNAFLKCNKIDEIVIVTSDEYINRCKEMFSRCKKDIKVVLGGKTRQQSVYNGICAANGDFVAIHDGARALVSSEEIARVVDEGTCSGAATLGVPVKDTIKIIDNDKYIKETPARRFVYQIQTPQVFKKDLIKKAHETGGGLEATDDCMLVEAMDVKVKVIDGSYENIKLTTREDMLFAEIILKHREE